MHWLFCPPCSVCVWVCVCCWYTQSILVHTEYLMDEVSSFLLSFLLHRFLLISFSPSVYPLINFPLHSFTSLISFLRPSFPHSSLPSLSFICFLQPFPHISCLLSFAWSYRLINLFHIRIWVLPPPSSLCISFFSPSSFFPLGLSSFPQFFP